MIRLALAILAFVFAVYVLVGSAWPATNQITKLLLVNRYSEAAGLGAIAVAVLAVGLLLCWPMARRFRRKQRTWSRRARIAARAGATAVVAPLTLLFALDVLRGGRDAVLVRECEVTTFPMSVCRDWFEACVATRPCFYEPYWRARWGSYYDEAPVSLFDAFERAMFERHVALGWTDLNNPEHRRLVNDDWGRALEAYKLRGLHPDPDSLGGEP